ncbi:hypothetical protein GCM10028815_30770 [Mariniluteicoccus flavus]
MHGEICGLRDGGCFQKFEGGSIYWKASTGAHFIRGRIFAAAWGGQGWENGGLGYPTTDEHCGLRDRGCVQKFEGGLGYWSFASDAHAVWGAIGQRYAQLGWENSPLGYPTGAERCGLRDGGCFQSFQGGLVYFSGASGSHAVWGAIGERYAQLGWENSPLGYPTGAERCGLRDGGCVQSFQRGLAYFSLKAGTNPVWGAIGERYAQLGWENSPLGYPTGAEFCGLRDGGCAQRFQGGLMYWSPRSASHPVFGAILSAYAAQGYERGGLGYPTSAEGRVEGTTITQFFQGGKLVFHTDTRTVDNGVVAIPGLVGGNYPDADAAPCGSSWCKNGSSMSGRGFAYRNCTDFAAFRRGMVWSQINGGGDGNAIGWRQGWIQRGRVVSNVPKVGSVAWWGASRGSGYGHVAIVIAVNPDGSAKVEHYNFSVRGGYSVEDVRAEAYLY